MNKNMLLAALLCAPVITCLSNSTEKRVKSDIKEVTVYLSGAQVTSKASVNLTPGTTNVVFEDLSQDINENNIQAKGEGDFTILSVVKKMNYLNNDFPSKQVALLQDSLESMHDRMELQQTLWKIYDQEELMMMSNKDIGGKNNGVSVAELEKAANLFRSRLTEIETKKIETKNKQKKIQVWIEKVEAQLDELNAKKNKPVSEVTVTVQCKSNVNATIALSYTIPNAGWQPFYNIRAVDNVSPVKLEYMANVWQNTGHDWNDVKITLATSNPYITSSKPNMGVWWIYPYQPYAVTGWDMNGTISPNGDGANDNFNPIDQIVLSSKRMEEKGKEDIYLSTDSTKLSNTTANYTRISENQVNTTFDISIPYDIPSDNKTYTVDVQTFSVPANYKYYCAPKLDKDAFLLARINSWDQYNLLTGVANIFYEGMYVGKSVINTQSTMDTLDISLGRDKNLVIEREKVKDLSGKKFISGSQKQTWVYEFSVRDKKKQDIEIEIEDQVPVSQDKDIVVEVGETSDAKYDKVTGKLTWSLKVAAGDTKKFKFGFSVRSPKDKTVSNLNS